MRTHRVLLVVFGAAAVGAATLSLVWMLSTTEPEALPTASTPVDDVPEGIGESAGVVASVETGSEESTGGNGSDEPAASWADLYWESADRFAFAEAAAKAAVAGDARAQYFLSLALLDCSVQVGLTAPMGRGSLAANIEARFEGLPGLREQDRERIRAQVMRCQRFFNETPFAGLSVSEEAQTHQYWFDQAVASGDPLAVMDRALKAVVQRSASVSTEDRRAALLSDVHIAVEAKDSGAIAKVGWLYFLQDVGRDHAFQGPAWLMAACELGYDCSMRNPEIGNGCAQQTGICNPAHTIADTLQRDLGAERFSAIYAASQDIVYKINSGDWDGLQQYLETKL